MTTIQLFKAYEEQGGHPRRMIEQPHENSGCSESCELFETIVEDAALPEWLK
jgi:hypothetical protein